MLEESLSETNEVSKRLNDRINDPQYLTDSVEFRAFTQEGRPGAISCEIDMGQGQEVKLFGLIDQNQPECPITDLKFCTNMKGAQKGVLDVLVQLCIGKHEQNLDKITVREVDYFLRDSNDVSAIEGGFAPFFPIFTRILTSIKDSISQSRGRRVGGTASPTISDDYRPAEKTVLDLEVHGKFEDTTVQNQLLLVNQVFDKYVRPFLYRDYGDIECVFIDGTMVVVQYLGACVDCSKALTSTMDYIQQVLRKELCDHGILVVTDS